MPGDNTRVKQVRIMGQLTLLPDAVVTQPVVVHRYYRAAGASEAYDTPPPGVEQGSHPDYPLPITTGIASDLTALAQLDGRMKLQIRLDVNGDVE